MCQGVDYCRLVSRADVDGDRRADQVALVEYGDKYTTTRSVVRVRTAYGRTMTRTIDGHWSGETSWHGSAAIDGRPGYELVIGRHTGAHMKQYAVLTFRNGQLATLKAPGGAWTWMTDNSYSWCAGWHRTTSNGQVVVTFGFAERDFNQTSGDPRYRVKKSKYVWSNGWWKPAGSKTSGWVGGAEAVKVVGWRIPYLPRD